MASTFLVSLDQLIQGIFQKDKDTIKNWEPDFSEVDEEKLKKHIEENDYAKHLNGQLEKFKFV